MRAGRSSDRPARRAFLSHSHHTGLPSIFPHTSPVTMLAELYARLPVEPYRLCNPAHRALPDLCGHPSTPGHINRSRQRDRSHLLRSHRLLVARLTDPPGVLLILWPGLPLDSKFLHIPGAFLPARVAGGLRLR